MTVKASTFRTTNMVVRKLSPLLTERKKAVNRRVISKFITASIKSPSFNGSIFCTVADIFLYCRIPYSSETHEHSIGSRETTRRTFSSATRQTTPESRPSGVKLEFVLSKTYDQTQILHPAPPEKNTIWYFELLLNPMFVGKCMVADNCHSSKRHKFVNSRLNFNYLELKIKRKENVKSFCFSLNWK